jgi:hypothetical protein
LLGFGPDDIESVAAVFRDVCVIDIDDGILFEADSVKTADIRKEAFTGECVSNCARRWTVRSFRCRSTSVLVTL